MFPAFPLVVLSLLALPLATAENADIRALGGSGGTQRGVLGFQWDDDSAVGVRYWFNMTGDDQAAFVITTCMVMDSGNGLYCERHHLTA